jgi:hypothetical protein
MGSSIRAHGLEEFTAAEMADGRLVSRATVVEFLGR